MDSRRPRVTGRYGGLDYAWLTKAGFPPSLTAFALGAVTELLAATVHRQLPAWEDTLFTDVEILGTPVRCSSRSCSASRSR